MNIILDCDDVLREFVPEVLTEYNKENNSNFVLDDIKVWNINQVLTNVGEFKDYITNRPYIMFNAKVCNNVYPTLEKLRENGHKITIATHQFKTTEEFTMRWLHKNNIIYDDIFMGRDKYLVVGDIFVDDSIENIRTYSQHHDKTKLFLMTKPWNKDLDISFSKNIKRISDLSEIIEYIK